MSPNMCYLCPQSIHLFKKGGDSVTSPFNKRGIEGDLRTETGDFRGNDDTQSADIFIELQTQDTSVVSHRYLYTPFVMSPSTCRSS